MVIEFIRLEGFGFAVNTVSSAFSKDLECLQMLAFLRIIIDDELESIIVSNKL